jgi:hypothetical protein
VALSVRSSQQIEHRGYSLPASTSLHSLSVIYISGRFFIEDSDAGGVPVLPICYSESRIMCCRIFSSGAKDRKFRFKLPNIEEENRGSFTIKMFLAGEDA